MKTNRCLISGNPCGTDTHPKGTSCLCDNCEYHFVSEMTIQGLRDRVKELEIGIFHARAAAHTLLLQTDNLK